jgi:hypothetical protein
MAGVGCGHSPAAEIKLIRAKLDAAHVPYDTDDRTLALLEKLLNNAHTSGEHRGLVALRTVQLLRSKAKGHVGGSDADRLAHDALMEHETFANHFRHVCTQAADELETIESVLS